jgi:hypothetical protein
MDWQTAQCDSGQIEIRAAEKKGLILRPALKGSLNLKVSKGPEETTCRNHWFQKTNIGISIPGFSLEL